jgi:hypothetical protein
VDLLGGCQVLQHVLLEFFTLEFCNTDISSGIEDMFIFILLFYFIKKSLVMV